MTEQTLTASAQLLDMRAQKLLPAVTESASTGQSRHVAIRAGVGSAAPHPQRLLRTEGQLRCGLCSRRLDAQENYVRGMLATTAEEKVQRYREAVRLIRIIRKPGSNWARSITRSALTNRRSLPWDKSSNLPPSPAKQISTSDSPPTLTETSQNPKARLSLSPRACRLAEVYNNLGVVAARRGQKKAADYFELAIQDDPSDADYHFNLGVALTQAGDRVDALRELHTALDHRPNDAEAKVLLDSLTLPAGGVVPSSATSKTPLERIKHNYEEDAFRQMTTQMASWAEQRFARSDPHTHARFHLELGNELMAHGFTTEAEAEFRHAAAVDPSSAAPLTALAEDYEARGDATRSPHPSRSRSPHSRVCRDLPDSCAPRFEGK